MLISVILVCVCVYLIYDIVCRLYIRPMAVNPLVAMQPGCLPILGHMWKWYHIKEVKNVIESIGRFSNINGGISVMKFGPCPVYCITHPSDLATVLNKCVEKLGVIYKLIEPLLGRMLVAADVPVWKRSRRLIDMAFKQNLLEEYLDLFNSEADRLVQAFSDDVGKGPVDVTDKVTKSFLEFTCQTTMGLKVDGKDLVSDKYVEATDNFMELIVVKATRLWNMWDPIFDLFYGKQMKEASKIFFSLSKEMVKLRKEEHLQRLNKKEHLDCQRHRIQSFLDILIENLVTETGSMFTDNELRNLVDNVLVAAFDTMINEMMLILVCIGSNHQVQDRIYQEIMDVLGDDEKVTRDNMNKLVYLETAIKETLRLYPIAMVVGRQASTDVQLRNNIVLPAGSYIMCNLWGTNRNPEFWGSDAEEYKPDRWLGDTLPDHPAAFASFSPGKRGCPGKMYALMSFKAVIVALLRKFKLTSDLSKLRVEYIIMLKPQSGHYIQIENRDIEHKDTASNKTQ